MCMKGEKSVKPKAGRFECKKCGVVAKSKKKMCKPHKIKD